jgi:hypothetical protein
MIKRAKLHSALSPFNFDHLNCRTMIVQDENENNERVERN